MQDRKPYTLSYGRVKRGRWLALIAVTGVALALVVGAICYKYRRAITIKANQLSIEHVCASYSNKPDLVIYEEDPTHAAKLIASNHHYGPASVSVNEPTNETPTAAAYQPPDELSILWGLDHSVPVLFLHGRASAKGDARLVLVEVNLYTYTSEHRILAIYTASRTRLPLVSSDVWYSNQGVYWVELGKDDCVRFFAGQASDDRSKFTIGYEFNGGRGVIEGNLETDGTVSLSAKSGNMTCRKMQ